MAKKTDKRVLVSLKCSECGELNYRTPKNTDNTTDKLILNKYCPKCRKTTEHKETKIK